MSESGFLNWVSEETNTQWWIDSASMEDIEIAISQGAVGVTTNPLLTARSLLAKSEIVEPLVNEAEKLYPEKELGEAVISLVAKKAADKMMPLFDKSSGNAGFVCAQVDPSLSTDWRKMVQMAERFSRISPNILVKLPATKSGIKAVEECTALGINTTATVSFSFSQMEAAAESHLAGIKRAKAQGRPEAKCMIVYMIGRSEDFLRAVYKDVDLNIENDVLDQIGEAIGKKALKVFNDRKYPAFICISGMRGVRHVVPFIGFDCVLSIGPKICHEIEKENPKKQKLSNCKVKGESIERLLNLKHFRKMYLSDGLLVDDFYSWGATQFTLTQFIESGWNRVKEIVQK